MRLLFLPYKPASDSSQEGPKISHQKHAAREHHRKAKIAKQQLRANHKFSNRGIQSCVRYGGQFIDWKVDSQEEAEPPATSPTTFLGAGRLDPFDVYCATRQPLMVHEMLDHGKSFVTAS